MNFSTISCLVMVITQITTSSAFQPFIASNRYSIALNDATGGWGGINSREMSDAEKGGKKRRSFEKYKAQDQGFFLRQLEEDRKAMKAQARKELLDVAAFAGIEIPKKDKNAVDANDLFMDDDDDLDVSVQFDIDEDGEMSLRDDDFPPIRNPDEDSITRMDDMNYM